MENQEAALGKHSGSHHGAPDLFERDIKLLQDYQLWIKTANKAAQKTLKRNGYESSYLKDRWFPSVADMLKSRLFWRIRSGKQPLPAAPPAAYSCAWYELIEVPGPHDCWPEEIHTYKPDGTGTGKMKTNRPLASINQCMYDLIEEYPDGSMLLEYSDYYRFKAWNGMVPTRTLVDDSDNPGQKKVIDSEHKGCWIEYIGIKAPLV